MKKPGVMIYHTLLPQVEMMSPTEAGELLLAILQYSVRGTYEPISRVPELLLQGTIPLIDRDAKKYEAVREQRRKAAQARWKAEHGEDVPMPEEASDASACIGC